MKRVHWNAGGAIMWEVNPDYIQEMHNRLSPIKTDLPLKRVLLEDFKADLPIDGGWGYSPDTAVRFIKTDEVYHFVQMEYQIAQWLLYEELIIFRPDGDKHSGIEHKMIGQSLLEHEGRKMDRLDLKVTCWHDFYWEKLKQEWGEQNKTNGPDQNFLDKHASKRAQSQMSFERTFYFDIDDVFGVYSKG